MLTWYFFNYVKIGLFEKFFYIKWITFPYGIICLNFLPKKPLEYFICIVFIITVLVIFVEIIHIIWWIYKCPWAVIQLFIPDFYFDNFFFFLNFRMKSDSKFNFFDHTAYNKIVTFLYSLLFLKHIPRPISVITIINRKTATTTTETTNLFKKI